MKQIQKMPLLGIIVKFILTFLKAWKDERNKIAEEKNIQMYHSDMDKFNKVSEKYDENNI